MGNWTMIVEGTGQHHNNEDPKDANKMFSEFVGKLKESGQNVEHATFTNGVRDILEQEDR